MYYPFGNFGGSWDCLLLYRRSWAGEAGANSSSPPRELVWSKTLGTATSTVTAVDVLQEGPWGDGDVGEVVL